MCIIKIFKIAIYSPHTAHDAWAEGVNTWLISGVTNGEKVNQDWIIDKFILAITPIFPNFKTFAI